ASQVDVPQIDGPGGPGEHHRTRLQVLDGRARIAVGIPAPAPNRGSAGRIPARRSARGSTRGRQSLKTLAQSFLMLATVQPDFAAVAVATEVGDADVVAPDDQNVGLSIGQAAPSA